MEGPVFSFTAKGKKDIYQVSFCLSALSFLQLIESIGSLLHPDEELLYLSYPAIERQFSFLQGRYAAKKALLQIQNKEIVPSEIRIDYGVFFNPIIKSVLFQNTEVSISHSGHLAAAIAFPAEIPCGIDIEKIDLSKKWCDFLPLTVNELKIINTIEYDRRVMIWSGKEALSKALKTGFTVDLKIFEIAEIKNCGRHYELKFKFFIYFKVYIWFVNSSCLAIALPLNLEVETDVITDNLKSSNF